MLVDARICNCDFDLTVPAMEVLLLEMDIARRVNGPNRVEAQFEVLISETDGEYPR